MNERSNDQYSFTKYIDPIVNLLNQESFLQKNLSTNDLPYYICPYDIKEYLYVCGAVDSIERRLNTLGKTVLCIDLYDVIIDILQSNGYFEQVLDMEPTFSKDDFAESMKGIFDMETEIIPYLKNKIDNSQFDILFIKGLGKVYPLIRAHSLLNNLPSAIVNRTTIIFFPGEYVQAVDGGSNLCIFNTRDTNSDRYYRAFNLINCLQ